MSKKKAFFGFMCVGLTGGLLGGIDDPADFIAGAVVFAVMTGIFVMLDM